MVWVSRYIRQGKLPEVSDCVDMKSEGGEVSWMSLWTTAENDLWHQGEWVG